MADAMDLAQLREQEDRERHISNARTRIAAPSRFLCEECDAPGSSPHCDSGRGFLRNLPANRRAKKQTLSGGINWLFNSLIRGTSHGRQSPAHTLLMSNSIAATVCSRLCCMQKRCFLSSPTACG